VFAGPVQVVEDVEKVSRGSGFGVVGDHRAIPLDPATVVGVFGLQLVQFIGQLRDPVGFSAPETYRGI
jgi:hypothetical protein